MGWRVKPPDFSSLSSTRSAKGSLRGFYRQMRRSLVGADLDRISAAVIAELEQHLPKSGTVLAYLGTPEEIQLDPLFEHLDSLRWGIPRCVGRHLVWHDYADVQDRWILSDYGIREPAPEVSQLDPTRAAVVLIPAVACDRWGTRLGYGGGFYDRFLTQIRAAKWGILPQSCVRSEPLPQDPWDQPLDAWVTETGFWRPLSQAS